LQDKSVPVVISAGRLAPEKGFPDLIRAIRIVGESRPVRLLILGEGPLAAELEALIDAQGLRDAIKLIGFRSNPHQYFRHANVFVLSSYVEGLPNVLVEAMECGCTPVATDCPTGPREVLQDGKYGALVPVRDPAAMAAAIIAALDHPVSPELLREAIQPFTEAQVIQRHRASLGI
jgi:glycosyltransferase involved in cell wall biosynthesis